MLYRDAVQLLRNMEWLWDAKTYYKNVCDCKECKDVIRGEIGNFISFDADAVTEEASETKIHCLKHYLNCKKSEYDVASQKSKEEIIADINKMKDNFQRVLGMDAVSYLDLWLKILDDGRNN